MIRPFALLLLFVGGCTRPSGSDSGGDTAGLPLHRVGELLTVEPPAPRDPEVVWVEVEWFGERHRVPAERDGDLLVYGGDIVVSPGPGAPPPPGNLSTTGSPWTDCTVPYEESFSSSIDTSDIATAITYWESITGITFVPRTTEANYVVFTEKDGRCSSSVGMVGGAQAINLDLDDSDGDWCSYGAVVHEIGHAVGLKHEHQRTDRDTYIVVNEDAFDNSVSWSTNFDTTGTPSGAYDLDSIMHYDSCSFSACGSCGTSSDPETCFTMYENNSGMDFITGHGETLSSTDVAAVAEWYDGTWYEDDDGDGYGDASSTVTACASSAPPGYVANASDCDDGDASTYPGATETCDGVDEDCDGSTDEGATGGTTYRDSDGDGYGDPSVPDAGCTAPTGYVTDGTDCDDTNASAHPGGTETCDGQDEDCDGTTDEDALYAATWYEDADGDGFGDRSSTVTACGAPSGYVADATDCDDSRASVHPGGTEVCDGAVDEDCDGAVDDDDPSVTGTELWHEDGDHDGYGDPERTTDACVVPSGYVDDATDCDDTRGDVSPGGTEVCDGDTDEDCDELVDDADPSLSEDGREAWYADEDGDGFGDADDLVSACEAPTGRVGDDTDCDDTDPAIHPAAQERCDDADTDEDCDGVSDDEDATVASADASLWYPDADGDGFGDRQGAGLQRCDQPDPDPYGWTLDRTDCDDADSLVHPGAEELCDLVDGDCDGVLPATESDLDGDGIVACAGDCDDADPETYPGAPEYRNGVDADCDGTADGSVKGCSRGCSHGTGGGALGAVLVALVSAVGRRRRSTPEA